MNEEQEKKIEIINNQENEKNDKTSSVVKKNIIYIVTKIALITLIVYVFLFHIFGVQIIQDENMKPTIKQGCLLMYYRLDTNYRKGDVVSITVDEKNYIVRIVALPNDKVEITDDGILLISGYPEDNDVYYDTVKTSDIEYPYVLKNNEYFVLNDFRKNTKDSRTFGGINKKQINGKVMIKIQIRDF